MKIRLPAGALRNTTLALSLALCTGLAAHAADALTDAFQSVYAPYRAALFTTNGKSAPDAVRAVETASAAWRSLVSQLPAQPAAPYERDKAFADTLRRVQAVYDSAEQQVKAGQLPQAHETLETVRDLLADLRRRNGVVVFSDHMNAYHAQMEHVLIDGPKMLAQPGGLIALAGPVGALDYLARRLPVEAPAALSEQPDFKTQLNAVLSATAQLQQALQRQDEAAVREALGKLKQPYSRLFLKFG